MQSPRNCRAAQGTLQAAASKILSWQSEDVHHHRKTINPPKNSQLYTCKSIRKRTNETKKEKLRYVSSALKSSSAGSRFLMRLGVVCVRSGLTQAAYSGGRPGTKAKSSICLQAILSQRSMKTNWLEGRTRFGRLSRLTHEWSLKWELGLASYQYEGCFSGIIRSSYLDVLDNRTWQRVSAGWDTQYARHASDCMHREEKGTLMIDF